MKTITITVNSDGFNRLSMDWIVFNNLTADFISHIINHTYVKMNEQGSDDTSKLNMSINLALQQLSSIIINRWIDDMFSTFSQLNSYLEGQVHMVIKELYIADSVLERALEIYNTKSIDEIRKEFFGSDNCDDTGDKVTIILVMDRKIDNNKYHKTNTA